ncbi:hypothetical protein, partial [Mesorhizobium sp. B3-1-9]|uniref:hypothetical protein n=1 Tax=Mesorhizobium sp. B3-1-9 TaxID=2589892 RepID=UPI001AED228F
PKISVESDLPACGNPNSLNRHYGLERVTVSRKNAEPLYPFVFTQFRTEGYGEDAELNRFTLFLELLYRSPHAGIALCFWTVRV